jgi:hypothetical protein
VFAPGHLGELTRIVPFELADAVLEEAGGHEQRVRLAPSRAGIYFLLAMCLFPQCGPALADRDRAGEEAIRDPGRDHVPRVPDGLLRRLQIDRGA